MKTAVDKFGHRVDFGYDNADNIRSSVDKKSETSPTATTTAYAYDKQNRLQTVTLPNAETVVYNWTADGLLERVNYASGMKREFGYDNADRITSIKNTINASEIQEFGYGYDANANRRTETKKINGNLSRSFAYQFDGLNRLAESRETTPAPNTPPSPGQSITVNETTDIKGFEYDAVGNREKEKLNSSITPITRTANAQGTVTETRGTPTTTPLQTATASFDALNRLINLTEANGTQNVLSYDNNGNLTRTTRNAQVQQNYEYDPRNQLRKVSDGLNAEVARFDYDVERRRVEKMAYGYVPERYVYAGDKIISEYRGNSGYETNLAKYQIGANEIVRGEFFNQSEGAKYYFTDALGSTTALAGQVNNAWTATNSYAYDSWGKVTNAIGSSNNSIGYTGQRLDNETGLMALGNGERYYSPTLARFIQQDSFTGSLNSGQSLNRFAYGLNNPLKFVDPSGNEGVIADWLNNTLTVKSNSSLARAWNITANTVAGMTYDAANLMTFGQFGASDRNLQKAWNGERVGFTESFKPNWYGGDAGGWNPGNLIVNGGVGFVERAYDTAKGIAQMANPINHLTDAVEGLRDPLGHQARKREQFAAMWGGVKTWWNDLSGVAGGFYNNPSATASFLMETADAVGPEKTAQIGGAAGFDAAMIVDGAQGLVSLGRSGVNWAKNLARVERTALEISEVGSLAEKTSVLGSSSDIGKIALPRTKELGEIATTAELLETGAIPGREGVILNQKVVKYSEIWQMSEKSGVEFALTRENGNFVLRSGAPNRVEIPFSVRPIMHTHPPDVLGRIQPLPSNADINTLNRLWELNPNGARPRSVI